ncbi:MAG TPA: thiamine-phosphate kinase [Rhodanobacteraceae bacterium]|nr:thiamine-phosphate kinase [Rhodanobacteraceae bacterium]
MNEFELIDLVDAQVGGARRDVVLGIGDDGAVLEVPEGQRLVACVDTMVAGVHFLPDTAPADLGWKVLAVNLSDLAAMGAMPAWALLALTLPRGDEAFVRGLAQGFGELARQHAVALVGGDTTQGPLTLTVTALGWVARGTAISRAGAQVGDRVFVTGTLGDAAGALTLLRQSGAAPSAALLARLQRPQPRIAAGLALRHLAGACIDVSDGLAADLGHICEASHVGAVLDADALPVSPALAAAFDAASCRRLALTGGDDYELCFTVAAARAGDMARALADAGCTVTPIGRIVAGSGVRAVDASGHDVPIEHPGWQHFAA